MVAPITTFGTPDRDDSSTASSTSQSAALARTAKLAAITSASQPEWRPWKKCSSALFHEDYRMKVLNYSRGRPTNDTPCVIKKPTPTSKTDAPI